MLLNVNALPSFPFHYSFCYPFSFCETRLHSRRLQNLNFAKTLRIGSTSKIHLFFSLFFTSVSHNFNLSTNSIQCSHQSSRYHFSLLSPPFQLSPLPPQILPSTTSSLSHLESSCLLTWRNEMCPTTHHRNLSGT